MIGCSLGKVILFINYLPYLATLFPFSLSSSLFLIFFKTTVSEFRAGKVISRPPQRQEESWYYSGSLQPNLRGFFHLHLKPTLLSADGKRWLLADPCDFFRVDHLSALHQLTRVPLASALAAACDFVL